MSLAEKIIPHYTYDDYTQWEGKWELIGGSPIAMSPSPAPKHQWVASNLRFEILLALKKTGCKNCKVYDPIDFKISEDTVLQPDIILVCGNIKKKFLDFPPTLVVEILSPATALRDRHTKFKIYEQQGVKWFLLVNTETESIEIFQLVNGNYDSVMFDQKLPFTFLLDDDCSIEVLLNEIWS